MAEITLDGKTFQKMQEELRRYKEGEGKEQWKKGEKGKALLSFGGANAPVLHAFLGGGAIYWLATSKWVNDIEFFQKHWYAKPLLVVLIGIAMWRKGGVLGTWSQAVIAAGAVMLARAYKAHSNNEKWQCGDESAGPDEAGAYEWVREYEPPAALPHRHHHHHQHHGSTAEAVTERVFRPAT